MVALVFLRSFLVRAIVLAAGRGQRMGALTECCPKPLLSVGGKTLIEHTIARLVAAGISQIVVNHAYLGEQIVAQLGDGSHLGVTVTYSPEPSGALETGGGILKALPLLGEGPFIAINADVYTDFDLSTLTERSINLAHIVLVPNPEHHPEGDFSLEPHTNGQRIANYQRATSSQTVSEKTISEGTDSQDTERYTFSGIGIYHPDLWRGWILGRFRLPPVLRRAMDSRGVTGEVYTGEWWDIGTAQRLADLRATLKPNSNV
jgi:N-acetyl-alpha-D-muramate 1-phosphate uridylyltransferase